MMILERNCLPRPVNTFVTPAIPIYSMWSIFTTSIFALFRVLVDALCYLTCKKRSILPGSLLRFFCFCLVGILKCLFIHVVELGFLSRDLRLNVRSFNDGIEVACNRFTKMANFRGFLCIWQESSNDDTSTGSEDHIDNCYFSTKNETSSKHSRVLAIVRL